MADNTKFVQCRNPKLQSAIDTSATEAVLTEFVDLAGNPLTQTDLGTTGYGTLEPNTAREEAISFTIDSNPSGTATLTIVRGLQGKSPYGTGGTAYAHEAQSELVISNNPDLLNKLTAKDNDEEVTGSWKYPANPTHNQNPVPKKYLEDNAVMKTGDQTVAGVKTFSDNPVVPDATAADEPTSKGQVDTLDAQNVKITGDQTVAGEKTFSTSPKVPDATAADEPYTKGQHDADASASSAVASPTVRGSAKLDTAADDPADPEVYTATSDRVSALAGGGDFGTPSASNKFLTEDLLSNKPPQVVSFTSSGTWTKDAGLKYIKIKVQSKGGDGGDGNDFGSPSLGGGGGGGGAFSQKIIPASTLSATETITIDATKASFGAIVECTNGSDGTSASSSSFSVQSGGNGGVATGGDLNVDGQNGLYSSLSGDATTSGEGGDSFLGFGGRALRSSANGESGKGYGSGGSGGLGTGSGQSGGLAGAAIIEVTEFYS